MMRRLATAAVIALALAGSATTVAAGCWPAFPVRLMLSADIVDPSCEATFEAEGGDIEATISFTILDHVPDAIRPLRALRRMFGQWPLRR